MFQMSCPTVPAAPPHILPSNPPFPPFECVPIVPMPLCSPLSPPSSCGIGMAHRWIRRASPHAVWLVRPPLLALFVSVTFPSSPPISIRAHLFPSPLPSPHLQSLLSPSLSVPPQPLIAYHPLRLVFSSQPLHASRPSASPSCRCYSSTLLPTQASSDLASQTIRNKNQRTAMSHPENKRQTTRPPSSRPHSAYPLSHSPPHLLSPCFPLPSPSHPSLLPSNRVGGVWR
ncbi:unnamed protein product [Closterium sp. NIES-65]|nr:unnamed protein product [Closterium sp. NIES-65]